MNIKFDKEKLQGVLSDVYELLHTPISIFDGDFRFVTSYPPEGYLTDYCYLIRGSAEGAAGCRRSDEDQLGKCRGTGKTFSYTCHAGIRETVTPIKFENAIMGYILFGEYVIEGDTPNIGFYAEKFGIKADELEKGYNKLTVLSEKQVEATCNILRSSILTFKTSDAISLKENELFEKITAYIDENLNEKLTVEDICAEFYISRRRLYSVFGENVAMPVKRYILGKKIERAKKLLSSTELSVTEIAEKTGFSDYNNFIQRFKTETGFSPLAYRKSDGTFRQSL